MVLVNISVLPHGTMVLEPSNHDIAGFPVGCQELHDGCYSAAQNIKDSAPDTIILITPHGISLKDSLAIYMNDSVAGSAEWNGYGEEFSVQYDCDVDLASSLISHLASASQRAEGVTMFSKSMVAPLRWGEVVPLWFLQSIQVTSKVIVVGLPQARFSPLVYADNATQFGTELFNFCERQSQRIALLFSCDLSHVHPIPSSVSTKYHCIPSLGTDEVVASTFDNLAVKWISQLFEQSNVIDARTTLSSEMAKWVVDAKACGWSGMCCIQGCLERMASSGSGTPSWKGVVHAYQHPSYYGMIVTSCKIHT